MIFVSLLAGLLSQFTEFIANLELAKLQRVGPIFKGGLPVIIASTEETTSFGNLSNSAGEGISRVLSINS
jgi:hypothetical protein